MKTSKSEINLLKTFVEPTKPIDIITSRSKIYTKFNMINAQNTNIDLNYSVYVDNPMVASSPDSNISKICPKQNEKWVDSNLIHKCQNCDNTFGFITRKHHCRACGGVFCSYCCNKYTQIPKNIIKIPEQDNTLKMNIKKSLSWFTKSTEELVCNTCDTKINDLKNVDHLIKIFEFVDLPTLYNLKSVSKTYRTAAMHIISKFRDIQYGYYIRDYNHWEIWIIWISREYLLTHNVWFIVLIKTILLYTTKTKKYNNIDWLEEILKNYSNNLTSNIKKNVKCFNLMCSRKCTHTLQFEDILEIYEYIKYCINLNSEILELIQIKNIIIYLTKILFKKINKNKIDIVIPLICDYFNNLFDYEEINMDNIFIEKIFNIFFNDMQYINQIISLIIFEKNYLTSLDKNINNTTFYKLLTRYINYNFGTKIFTDIVKLNNFINNIINNKINYCSFPIIYPFNPNYNITKINSIKQFTSNTKPLLIDVEIIGENKEKKNTKFIIKKSVGLRKEQIISNLINILQYKISIFNFEEIPTYQIIMLNHDIALLEYIDNSITLRQINDKGYTLQNYILNHNINSKLDIIKTKFVNSLAISSAIAYIIGIGDRHLDNIMINNNGQIFHVDYGYILENPTIIFNMPEIKVTNEIIDFLGGTNSIYYNEFKKLIVQVYNQCRANKNIIYIYFKYICDNGYMDWNMVYNKLDSKLMTGMKCKDVEISLINQIESSNSYIGMFADICHTYKQKFFS
jgi:hypothetical protein